MRSYFVNFSNHPSEKWGKQQTDEALMYGEIVDVPFPAVDPEQDEDDIRRLAEECVSRILKENPAAVLCQGEYTLAYQTVCFLRQYGICVLAACSSRQVQEKEGKKEVTFEFIRFREYRGDV